MNICVQVFTWMYVFISLLDTHTHIHTGVELLGHMAALLTFHGPTKLLSTAHVPFDRPTMFKPQLLHILNQHLSLSVLMIIAILVDITWVFLNEKGLELFGLCQLGNSWAS